jgi:hypothetical protein
MTHAALTFITPVSESLRNWREPSKDVCVCAAIEIDMICNLLGDEAASAEASITA